MAPSLFRSGFLVRLIAAVAFAIFAFGSVVLLRNAPAPADAVEIPSTVPFPPQPTTAPPVSDAAPERIEIESVLAIKTWTVRFDGETITAEAMDAHRWAAHEDTPAGTLSIDALPTEALPSRATNALRIHLRATTGTIEWVEWVQPGELTVVALDQLRAGVPAAPPPAGNAP